MTIWNDKDSEFYVKKYGNHFSIKLLSKLISFKSNNNILDLGCAGGDLIKKITENNSIKTNIYGIDSSSKMIEIANKKKFQYKINLCTGNAENLQFKNNFFNIILIINTIFHFKDINKALNETYRVMNKKGTLYIGEQRLNNGNIYGYKNINTPKKFLKKLDEIGWKDIITKEYFYEDKGLYLFSAKK